MSYILDALKKSEQEHKKGQVPGLGTVQGLPGPGGRFETDRLIWIYGLATLLLAVVVIGTWLYLRKPAPAPAEAPPVTIGQLPTDSQAPETPTTKPTTSTQTTKKPATAQPIAKTGQPTPPQPPTAGAASPQLLKVIVPKATGPSSPPATTPVIVKPPPPVRAEEPAQERQPATGTDKDDADENQIRPEQMVPVPVEDLPAETRAELPEIKIGVHLYSDTPTARRASINGRLMREGQQVDKELTLVEIIKQGVILSFRGRRFTLPVFPR